MTQHERSSEMIDDPVGSIFLPKTEYPEEEFASWYFQLMLVRGVGGYDKTIEEIAELHEALAESKKRYLADVAMKSATT